MRPAQKEFPRHCLLDSHLTIFRNASSQFTDGVYVKGKGFQFHKIFRKQLRRKVASGMVIEISAWTKRHPYETYYFGTVSNIFIRCLQTKSGAERIKQLSVRYGHL